MGWMNNMKNKLGGYASGDRGMAKKGLREGNGNPAKKMKKKKKQCVVDGVNRPDYWC